MGHQLARPTVATAVAIAALVAACGGDRGEAEVPAVLDNARALVTAPSGVVESDVAETVETAVDAGPQAEELPAPDPSTFVGRNRIINLWVGAGLETTEVDVWARRTFTNGPVLLASEVPFASASEYFTAPPGHSLVIVGAGAGPDGVELAGIFNAAHGEQATTIFTNRDEIGSYSAPTIWEFGSDQAVPPPTPGSGLVLLRTANTGAYTDQLTASIGGDSFYVGDGSPECREQRIESDGFQASVLGGTQVVELQVEPGQHTISLHPWFSPDECDQPATLSFAVELSADAAVMAVVYSRDGASIETLIVPVASGAA